MVALWIQTALLIAIAFILGCVIGSLLRWLLTSGSATEQARIEQSPQQPMQKAAAAAPAQPVPVAPPAKSVVPEPGAPVAPGDKAPVAEPVEIPDTVESKVEPFVATAAPEGPADNLKLIRGIGPQNEARLNALGVTQFTQIAAWSAQEQRAVGEALAFPGRIEREEWTSQAATLAKGEKTDFSQRVASGTVASSMGETVSDDVGTKPAGTLIEARGGTPDDLPMIGGVGSAIEKKMFKLGIYHFDQVSGMSSDELVWLGNAIGFPGRPERENWMGDAKALAAGAKTKTEEKPAKRGTIKAKKRAPKDS